MTSTRIALLGAPHDENSSFMRGPARAPTVIRTVMHNGAANAFSESGVDTAALTDDLGDLAVGSGQAGVMQLETSLRPHLDAGFAPLVLGGDHAITNPLVRAVAAVHGPLDILHFDAHGDLYPNFDNNPYSHASPFARILEAGCAASLTQVGIRTLTPEQQTVIERHGVHCHAWNGSVAAVNRLQFDRPVYVSLDIDALDPAFAPGVSHQEPGGMSVRDVLDVLHGLSGRVVGADIVEFNPQRDRSGQTAAVCVKFIKELTALMAR